MRRTSFEEMNCSVAQTLEVVGDWWTMLIVRDCFLGITRFEAFSERLGIARNILTDRLQHLVEHGVLTRVAYQDRPARYDYRLTDKGRDLWLVLHGLRSSRHGDAHLLGVRRATRRTVAAPAPRPRR